VTLIDTGLATEGGIVLTAAPIDTEIRLANAPAHISAATGPRGSGTDRLQSLSPLIAALTLAQFPIVPLALIDTRTDPGTVWTATPIDTETAGRAGAQTSQSRELLPRPDRNPKST
jgi:hypothetical protein